MDFRTWGGGGVGFIDVRVTWIYIYILPSVKWIASGKQPHSTGRSAW